jgi:hypothetical protein
LATPEASPEKRVPDPDKAPKAPDTERRAILRALGSSPVILTLVAGSAHAEYIDGVYRPGEEYVPEDGCDPDRPGVPPGQDPQPGCGNDHR